MYNQHNMSNLRLVGKIFIGNDVIDIRWSRVLHSVLLTLDKEHWLVDDTRNIASCLEDVTGVSSAQMQVMNMLTFNDSQFHYGNEADVTLITNFLLCDWTDYTHDNIGFHTMLAVD